MALGAKKYRLLGFMMVQYDQVFTRERLLHDVWDQDFDTSTNVVDYVRYLWAKIDEPFGRQFIHTMLGKGHIMYE